ncbi:hypothetical protein [Geodermatophilus sabuli]|uniref:Uncharacterized protein n=1 Tax=Geodermatophilus sabuli TaxID=1564158 RepID=A0A285E7W5_9ACTN|nr:hypothetical protein [Geodermatophilus sabuli]MBB3082831.1 hypothetical protein [Geodermatophilus sabuli]SNX94304.1 hypothetical protein SAMN06893097_10194 [Geodermatophilus sabuli]
MVIRRTLTVIAAAAVMLAGGPQIAGAAFDDRTAPVQATVGTVTVQPPRNVQVATRCETTTTVVKRVYQVNSTGGRTFLYAMPATVTKEASRENKEGEGSTEAPGPLAGQVTVTTTTMDTELYATATWDRSPSDRVAGYQMRAHLGNGYVFTMMQSADTTSMSANADASYLSTQLQLTIDTVTTYRWTASSALTKSLRC